MSPLYPAHISTSANCPKSAGNPRTPNARHKPAKGPPHRRGGVVSPAPGIAGHTWPHRGTRGASSEGCKGAALLVDYILAPLAAWQPPEPLAPSFLGEDAQILFRGHQCPLRNPCRSNSPQDFFRRCRFVQQVPQGFFHLHGLSLHLLRGVSQQLLCVVGKCPGPSLYQLCARI